MATSNPVVCGSIAGRPGPFGVAMHTAAYRALGLDWIYVAFGCDDTEGAVQAMRTLGIRGLGVTMPHKVRILPYLDRVSDDARAIGAVNTVVNDDGLLTGHNVDWQGALAALDEAIEPAGCLAAVIGAGGGARAIAHGLIRAGARVVLFNRTEEAGGALAARLGCTFGGPPQALAGAQGFDLVCHATPVGFHDPGGSLIDATGFAASLVVFDAVPVPIETALLKAAAGRGCRTVPGIRMQLHQAALQCELYTGRRPDLAVMEAALRAAMARI
jgi:shikimate dehydrogenase